MRSFKDKKWTDESSVGTGHRGIIFMQYPVYALAWPMLALARYRKLFFSIGSNNNSVCD
jgi:hypothetical protein